MFIKPYFQSKNTRDVKLDKLEVFTKLNKLKVPTKLNKLKVPVKLNKLKTPLLTLKVPRKPTKPTETAVKHN